MLTENRIRRFFRILLAESCFQLIKKEVFSNSDTARSNQTVDLFKTCKKASALTVCQKRSRVRKTWFI